jgi:hypothetical protein
MARHNANDIAHHRATSAGHGRAGDGQLRLDVSSTLHARLVREAAERGMRLEDWAVLKLGVDPDTRVAHLWLEHARPVPRSRTRC